MLGLTRGELFIVVFIVVAVVFYPWWPRLGGALGVALGGKKPRERGEHGNGP